MIKTSKSDSIVNWLHKYRRVTWKDQLTVALIYNTDFSNTYYHPSSGYIEWKNSVFAGLVRLSSSLFALLSTKTSFREIRLEYSDHLALILCGRRLALKWSCCLEAKIGKPTKNCTGLFFGKLWWKFAGAQINFLFTS